MREIIVPAHHLLHSGSFGLKSRKKDPSSGLPSAQASEHVVTYFPLEIPSEEYDILRATVIQAELLTLRILGLELRVASPFDYLPRYLSRVFADNMKKMEDYDALSEETRAEHGISHGGILETRIGRAVKAKVVEACEDERVGLMFPSRVVALGCIWVVLENRGVVSAPKASEEWVTHVGGPKVSYEDWVDVVEELRGGRGHVVA